MGAPAEASRPKTPAISQSVLTDGIKEADLASLRAFAADLAKDDIDPGNPKKVIRQKLTTSQLRKFFGEIRRIQADFENCKADIVLLDPKIAYAVGRALKDGKSKIEDFYNFVRPLILAINADKGRFRHFVNVVESIVAYHRAAEGA